MRGRIAAFAIGSAVATRRTQAQAQQAQPQQEDVTQKLQKLADLHKQGILSDEEFQKLKMDLIEKL